MHTSSKLERARIEAAARGDRAAQRWLVARLTPLIHSRVAATLERSGLNITRSTVEDVVQDVWAGLCAHRFRDLMRWQPSREATLTTFVSVCAERRAIDFIRSGRRNASAEEPVAPETLAQEVDVVSNLEGRVAAKHLAARLVATLRAELSPRGNEALQALYLEGMAVDEAAKQLRTTKAALYSWRRDIRRLAERLLEDWAVPHDA